jgi:hypothetical protein
MNKLFLVYISLLVLALSACALDPNEQFIQGTWSIARQSGGTSPTSEIEFFEWRFRNGTFLRQHEFSRGSVLVSNGRYRILESKGDVILLELFDIKGERFTYANNPVDIEIQINRDQDTIQIGRMWFERVLGFRSLSGRVTSRQLEKAGAGGSCGRRPNPAANAR